MFILLCNEDDREVPGSMHPWLEEDVEGKEEEECLEDEEGRESRGPTPDSDRWDEEKLRDEEKVFLDEEWWWSDMGEEGLKMLLLLLPLLLSACE